MRHHIESSLFYNTSARHEQHKCDTSNTNATQARHERRECSTSAILARRVRYEWDTSATQKTRVRNEWEIVILINDTSENLFSHIYISYVANEILQGKEQFHSKNFLLEMPRSHSKMHLKSAPQKLNFVMATLKIYILDFSCKCFCTFPHSYA